MIHLEPGSREDLSKVLEWNEGTGAEFLMQWAGPLFRHPLTEQQLLDHWGPTIDRKRPNARFYRIATETTIGVVELGLIDRMNGSARVARFLLGEEASRGKGFGTVALRLLLDVCFARFGFHRVSLAVFDFNEPAIRCYEKVGFRKEGHIREARRVGDNYWSYYEMGILRNEWLGSESYD